MANLFLGPKQSQSVPLKKERVLMNHECFQCVKNSELREDPCSCDYRMPKLIILSDATGSVCPVGPCRRREISGASASWFVASVWSAYSWDKLKDGAHKPQGPVAPDP